MKTGTTVRLIQPVIQGVIKDRRLNPTTDELEALVQWTDVDGQAVERWFDLGQLEPVELLAEVLEEKPQ